MFSRLLLLFATLYTTGALAQPVPSPTVLGSGTTVIANGGATPRTLSAWFGDQVNVLGQGVAGNGSTNDATTLLAAVSLAQTAGKTLIVPPPTSSYLLNSNVTAPMGDLFVNVSPGYVASGAGLLQFDNQIPFQHPHVFSFNLLSKTYGAAWNGYSNVMQNASVAIQNGTTAAVVAVYGEGLSYVPYSGYNDSWGANFVGGCMVAASACFGTEIDVIAGGAGTSSKGLSLNAVNSGGAFQPQVALFVTANNSTSAWLTGVIFDGSSGNNPVSGGLIQSTYGAGSTIVVTPNKFIDFTSASAVTDEIDLPSFQVQATNASMASRISVRSGTVATGSPTNAARITAIPPYGSGALTAIDLTLEPTGTGILWGQNGSGLLFEATGGGTTYPLFNSTTGNGAQLLIGGTVGNLILAKSSAHAAGDTINFPIIPTTPGIPTGTVGSTGQAAISINTSSHKFCHSEGAGTWYDATGAACS